MIRPEPVTMHIANTNKSALPRISLRIGAECVIVLLTLASPFVSLASSSYRIDDPAPPHVALPEDRRHPHAKIAAISRDTDGKLILHLNKGTDARLKAGMKGFILEGRDGDMILAGGEFTITEVIDDDHCVAKTSLKRIGKNNRCVIYTIVD